MGCPDVYTSGLGGSDGSAELDLGDDATHQRGHAGADQAELGPSTFRWMLERQKTPRTLNAGFGGFVVNQCLEPDAELEPAILAAVAAPARARVREQVP